MIIYKNQNEHKYNKENHTYILDMIDCGVIQSQVHWMHSKRFLEKYEMIFVTKGSLYLQIDKTNYTLAQNDLLVIPPYKTISGIKESEKPTSFYWVDFQTDHADSFGVITEKIHVNQPDKLLCLFDELISVSHQNTTSGFTKDSVLVLLFHQMQKNVGQDYFKHQIITKFCNYIDEHITKPLSAQMVADALDYNKDYLSRIIKKNFNLSVIDYINKQKMNLAKKLLSTSKYSITEISNYLGYDDRNLFTKYFKYHENVSPKQYRNGQVD